MPKLITERDEFGLLRLADNKNDTSQFMAGATELQVGKWKLYKKGNIIRLIEQQKDEYVTLYHVQYITRHKKQFGHQVTQVEVWKMPGSSEKTSGLPKDIFFQYLLKNFNVIISDYQQTADGMRFWTDRIIEAINDSKYEAYCVEYNTNTLTQIRDVDHFYDEIKPRCWGYNDVHEQRRAAIMFIA